VQELSRAFFGWGQDGRVLRPGHKLITVPMNEEFIRAVNAGIKRLGYGNRSDFIRDAIVEKLARDGIVIDPALAAAPSRAGVGGSPAHKPVRYGAHKPANAKWNDAASSSPPPPPLPDSPVLDTDAIRRTKNRLRG
jgi:hypothetical protein